jgi:2-methylcitrate synthase
MRTGCSFLGSVRPEGPNGQATAGRLSQFDVFDSLLASFGNIMLYWYHFHQSGQRVDTKGRADDTIARHFMRTLHPGQEPKDEQVRTVDLSLILYAEHGYAASNFACRVTTSTMSDAYSAVCTAIGTATPLSHHLSNLVIFSLNLCLCIRSLF